MTELAEQHAPACRRTQAAALIDLSHERLLAALQQHANVIGPQHSKALRDLLEGLTNQALGIAPGRFAYAMPCGAGKTLGMTVWLATAWELGVGISVAVAASQIKALCTIRDGLTQRGVPESAIGLRHSYSGAAAADYPPDTGDADRPIMLLSHERLRRGRDRGLLCTHLGQPRSLLIWDESLLATQADSLSWVSTENAAQLTLGMMSAQSAVRQALAIALAELCTEVERQRQNKGATPRTLTLLEDVDLQEARAELDGLRCRDALQRAAVGTMRDLLRLARGPVSVALPGGGASNDGLIHYSPAIDPALQNIAVLDASFAVRTLAQGGGLVDRSTPAMRNCKTYEQVSVRMIPLRTGRSTLVGGRGKQRLAELVRHVADAIRGVPDDERALVITFKDGAAGKREQPCPLQGLLSGLKAEGIDLQRDVPEQRRIRFLTWGNETSLNEFSDCRHVIMAGVLRRNHLDLTACMAGQRDDHTYRMQRQELQALELSEIAHCVLQGMSRGACRTVDAQGRAGAMKLTILAHVKGLQGALADSLPRVRWQATKAPGRPKCGGRGGAGAIAVYLGGLPPGTEKVPCRHLKAETGCSELKQAAWEYTLHGALFALRGEWKHEGRSVLRVAGTRTYSAVRNIGDRRMPEE